MKKEDLKNILRQNGISENYYNLDDTGRTDERFCLKKIDSKWYVYYCERGIKTTNKSFISEEDACQFIYEQLLD